MTKSNMIISDNYCIRHIMNKMITKACFHEAKFPFINKGKITEYTDEIRQKSIELHKTSIAACVINP